MKRAMWIIAILCLLLSIWVITYLPETVPMHENFRGEVDRYGSRWENMIFPVIILLIALMWDRFAGYYEKKAVNAPKEKDRAEAASNAKVLNVVGVAMVATFTVMQAGILWNKLPAENGITFDVSKLSFVMTGLLLIVLSNFMTKSKKNPVVGVRVTWSMYNENTWRKSNRFGAIVLMITGAVIIVTAFFASVLASTLLLLLYVAVSTTVILVYSKRVYEEERAKETQNAQNTE